MLSVVTHGVILNESHSSVIKFDENIAEAIEPFLSNGKEWGRI